MARRFVPVLSAVVSMLLSVGSPGAARADETADFIALAADGLVSGMVQNIGGAPILADNFINDFYDQRSGRVAWFGTPAAAALLSEIILATKQGFRPPDFHMPLLLDLQERAKAGGPQEVAAFDVVATDAAARLLHHVIFGKVDPARMDSGWNFDRPVLEKDPASVLNSYLDGAGFAALMDQLVIGNAQYLQLTDVLALYRDIAARGGWPQIPEGPALKPDMEDDRVPVLRERLAVEGDYTLSGTEGTLYDADLVAALERFQSRHGLTSDGVIGPRTLLSLNRTVDDRVDQLRLSLERFRWFVRGLEDSFVLVNIAGARTFLVLDGELAWTTRSITGSEYRQTPVFRDDIDFMVFNPTWTVPASILRKDKLSRIRKDLGYLDRNGYSVRNRAGETVSASSINWSVDNPAATLVQKPGPDNALGLVKFMFPNEYSVYLHDTSNRELFDREERNISSGCVRVEDPFVLAGLLMRDAPGWTQERMQEILDSGRTTRVDLVRPIPVLLTYWTAWVENGAVQFREDPYDRDPPVLKALNALQ